MGLCTESIATECVLLEASKTGRREEGSWAERGGLLEVVLGAGILRYLLVLLQKHALLQQTRGTWSFGVL